MRRLLSNLCFMGALLLGIGCIAQAQYNSFPPGMFMLNNAGDAPSYVGPGNVVSGAFAWWGLRAYDTAHAGTKAVNVCNDTGGVDVLCEDYLTDTSGNLVIATIGGVTCASLGTNCKVAKIYDQSGANSCGAGTIPCDVAQATVINRPVLNPSCLSGLACLVCTGVNGVSTSFVTIVSTWTTITQPYTTTNIFKRTANTTTQQIHYQFGPSNVQGEYFGASGQYGINAGSSLAPTGITENAFHASQNIYNGASSQVNVDGGATNGAAGAGTIASGTLQLCDNISSHIQAENLTEWGLWRGAFSAGNITAMNSNQHAYWGF